MAERTKPRPKRSNGEGAIYATKDGRLRGALVLTDPRTGKLVRRFVSGRSRAEVVRRLEDLRKAASVGALPTRLTTAEYLTGWLARERVRVRPSTWRQRDQVVRTYLVPALGTLPLARLAPADVERMTSQLVASRRAPRTAASARVILRRALGDALRDGLVTRNVAALARPPRVPTRDMVAGRDYLANGELRRLVDAAREDQAIGPLVIVAATTGLRQGELLGLAWTDVRLEAPASLTVRRSLARAYGGDGWELAEPKTPRSRRTVNLPAAAVQALEAQRAQQDVLREAAGSAWQDRDELVFTDAIGRPLRGYNVTRQFHELLERAGLPSIPFHGLRHTAATAMLTAGVPLRVVADVLGHATITITANTYAAVVPELRREAADAMDRTLGGGA